MRISVLLGFAGVIYAVAVAVIIYVYFQDDVYNAVANLDHSAIGFETALPLAAMVLLWLFASIPGFILIALAIIDHGVAGVRKAELEAVQHLSAIRMELGALNRGLTDLRRALAPDPQKPKEF